MLRLKFVFHVAVWSWLLMSGISCSSISSEQKEDKNKGKSERPAWIFSPSASCSEQAELCAVGEGKSLSEAQSEARRAIALVFEAKVSGEKNFYRLYNEKNGGVGNNSSSDVGAAINQTNETSESASMQLHEATDEILKGVIIKEQFEDGKESSFYALASLDRFSSSSELKRRMEGIDEELTSLSQTGKGRGAYKKMLDLYQTRESLNSRYQMLRGVAYPCPIDLKEIYNKKQEMKGTEERVWVEWSPVENFSELSPFILGLLTENNYSIVDSKNNSQWTLKGSLKQQEEYLNIVGFKRYSFVLTLTFYNSTGEKVKVFEKNFIENGRNYQQVWQKVLAKFKDYLQEEWKYLSIIEN